MRDRSLKNPVRQETEMKFESGWNQNVELIISPDWRFSCAKD